MRNHEEDAHNALQEAIDNGGKLTMRIPAEPDRDTDLRISRALKDLRELSALIDRVKSILSGENYKVAAPATVRVTNALAAINNYEEDNK